MSTEPYYSLYRIFTTLNSNYQTEPYECVETTDNYSDALRLVMYYASKYGVANAYYEVYKRDISSNSKMSVKVYSDKVSFLE